MSTFKKILKGIGVAIYWILYFIGTLLFVTFIVDLISGKKKR